MKQLLAIFIVALSFLFSANVMAQENPDEEIIDTEAGADDVPGEPLPDVNYSPEATGEIPMPAPIVATPPPALAEPALLAPVQTAPVKKEEKPADKTTEKPVAPEEPKDAAAPATDAKGEAPVEGEAKEEEKPSYMAVVLQGLNKVTARISKLEAPVGTSVRFGNLEIITRRCWKSPADSAPENAALVEIWEHKADEPAKAVFHGWMFSSSPSLSGLEHPIYDVIVLGCEKRELGGDT